MKIVITKELNKFDAADLESEPDEAIITHLREDQEELLDGASWQIIREEKK